MDILDEVVGAYACGGDEGAGGGDEYAGGGDEFCRVSLSLCVYVCSVEFDKESSSTNLH